MEAEVTTMASGGGSSKLEYEKHCVTCGIHILWTPRMWECDVCGDYFLCENCHKGSQDVFEVMSAPRVHKQDHHMSPHEIGSRCDGCGSNPIWNRRWRCKLCEDFDLCEACHGGLDAMDMPLDHLKEHPMIAIEVICSDMLLKMQPSFTKPMDPQWSYHVEGNSQNSGFVWEKKKPMSGMLSGMDDSIILTQSNAIEVSSVPTSKLKEQSTHNSRILISNQEIQATQTNGILDKKHKIFLSHAGAEKDFVEQLFRDLSRVHHFGIFFDKDDDSLPKGEAFSKRIFDAAKHCELAVVVISHEYFIRKWPMLELAAFVKAQSTWPVLKILPVFYKLSVEEFKQQQHLFEKHWKGKAFVSKDEVDGWKEALKVISRINGLEYNKRRGEVDFRDRIVEAIHKRVKPELMWDVSHVQGKPRMQEMIQEMIRCSSNAIGDGLMVSTLRMGLFGMGGSGKTTMCKVLGNQMMGHFLGRVHHVDFGSGDSLQRRVKLLQSMCELESGFLQTVDDGQALTLLKTHIPEQRICLLIDNVSDNPSCIEEARTLLNLPFKEGSLIVVTSRSPLILETLEIERRLTMRIPSLTREEAKALFSHHARCNTSHLTKEQMQAMESFVEQCNFRVQGFVSQEYHPLALKVLGSRMGPSAEKWRNIRINYKYYESENMHPIFSILRSSFDTLNMKYQRIFLDIATRSNRFNLRMEGLKWEMRCLYGESDEQFGSLVVEVLQAKSLVDFYDVVYGDIYVHDLYREFARMEVEKKGLQHSARCCFSRGSKRLHVVEEGRICIYDHPISHITNDTLTCRVCSEANLLTVEGCANLVSIDVSGMENLKIFDVIDGCPQLKRVNLEGAVSLRSFYCKGLEMKFYPNLTDVKSLEKLELINDEVKSSGTLFGCLDFSKSSNLEVLHVSYLPLNMLNLNQAVSLKRLVFGNCQHLERFEGLEALVHLETLGLEACSSLMEFPSLANFSSLEEFWLEGATQLKQIQGFACLSALRLLILSGGMQLEELPGIEACTRLSELWLDGTSIIDCSWVSRMKDLTIINLEGTKIRFMPDCGDLSKLFSLDLSGCQALESIGDDTRSIPPAFPQSLQVLTVRACSSLHALPEFQYESALHILDLSKSSVEDVSSVVCCKQLQKLYCSKTQISSLPDLGCLTTLKELDVHGCKLLIRMNNTKSLPALEKLWVYGCTSLLALPGLRSSTRLVMFELRSCPLVDPNAVELRRASNVDMDIVDVVDDHFEHELVYSTSRVADIEELELANDLWRSTTLINLVAKIASWCCGFIAN